MADEVIQASRGKAIAMVVICAVLAAITTMMLADPAETERTYAALVLLLSTAGIVFFGWRTARPRRLTIQSEGLVFRPDIGGSALIPWCDMEEVFVWHVDTASLLAYRVKPGEGAAVVEAAKSIRSLGGGWPGAVETIAARLEAYRAGRS